MAFIRHPVVMRVGIALGLFGLAASGMYLLYPLFVAAGIWAWMAVSERWRSERLYLVALIVPIVWLGSYMGTWWFDDGGCYGRDGIAASETARVQEHERFLPVPHTDCSSTEPGRATVEAGGDWGPFLVFFCLGLALAALWMWRAPVVVRMSLAWAAMGVAFVAIFFSF